MTYENGTDSVPKRWHLKFRCWVIPQKKEHNIIIIITTTTTTTTIIVIIINTLVIQPMYIETLQIKFII
jgi:hypothetical protein